MRTFHVWHDARQCRPACRRGRTIPARHRHACARFNSQFLLANSLVGTGNRPMRPSRTLVPQLTWIPILISPTPLPRSKQRNRPIRAAIKAIQNPKSGTQGRKSGRVRGIPGDGVRRSRSEDARAARLAALPEKEKDYLAAKLLAVLGDTHEALKIFERGIGTRFDWPSLLWYPSMRGVLSDPAFPAVAQRLGLMNYWRASHIRPDACAQRHRHPFCRMI